MAAIGPFRMQSLQASASRCDLNQILHRAAGTGQEEIIEFLSNPGVWPQRPATVELLETHMALLFFIGDRVFKMKRAIQIRHMDMRCLETRREFCRREVELNAVLAPQVYLGIASVTREKDGNLALDGDGVPVEPLVIMQRLDLAQGLDQRILNCDVTLSQIDRICGMMSDFYMRQPPADVEGSEFVELWREMVGRVRVTLADPQFALDRRLVDPALELLTHFLTRHSDLLQELVDQGWIVDGHGDLKPEHIVLRPRLLVIDRIEFDDRLRMTDPFAEMIFLGLECERLGAAWIGPRLIAGLAERMRQGRTFETLRFYRCYQACLRARLSIEHLLDATPRTPERWPVQTRDYLKRALCGNQSYGSNSVTASPE